MERRSTNRGSSTIKLSTDPQSVTARQRRHRISDRFRILKSLVPGGSKMDTVSMLEEAINYVKFLKNQIWLHQAAMMVPNYSIVIGQEATPVDINPSSYDGNKASGAYCNDVMPINEEVVSYVLPPPPPTLAPFPYCSFEEDEGMYTDSYTRQ